ncbi:unnamed protein product [Lathyrus sativus]|nr:unnamed protein product [Lathyrus sativus]
MYAVCECECKMRRNINQMWEPVGQILGCNTNIMELVGLGYTGWFLYRYLLFKSSRKELATDIEALKKKIAGTE